MNFTDFKLKNIALALNFQTTTKHWIAKNRSHHIIGIALSGNEFHDLGYQHFNIEENCIFFLNKKDDFTVFAHEMGACYSIHFTTYEDIDTDSFCIKINAPSPIVQLFVKQLTLLPNTHSASSNFYRLCALFEDIRQKKYAPRDQRIFLAKEYLDLHFCEQQCLSKVYETCNLSRRRFDELFKRYFFVTPNKYILSKKIEHAKILLILPNVSIQEVADLCGFSDIYYFSKVFKNETNYTPRAFRKAQTE